ncbi:hypothetical protein [Oceaniradius stylonematis]|uniref:hypothetical protein n=1 Tax=Oceaniradius stylonematis TaxID=2184161 RepID=UPI003C7AFE98
MSQSSTSVTPVDRYYAQPYSIDAVGFAFTSLNDFQSKAIEHSEQLSQPREAYALHLLDGPHQRLFQALDISPVNLAAWFRLIDEIDGEEQAYGIACCLAENGIDLSEVAATYDNCMFWQETAEEYARDFVQHEAIDWLEQGSELADYMNYHLLGRNLIRQKAMIEVALDLVLVRFDEVSKWWSAMTVGYSRQ